MRYKVTKPITKYGTRYELGEVVDNATPTEQSLARLLGWEKLGDEPDVSVGSMNKPELVAYAESLGHDVTGMRKADILDLLDE